MTSTNRTNKICKTAKVKNLGNYQETLKAHDKHGSMLPSKEVIVPLRSDEIIELTMKKTKVQKHTSPVMNSCPGQKQSINNNNEPIQNWSNTFRQQNLLHMVHEKPSKYVENKKVKKNIDTKSKQQRSTIKQHVVPINNTMKSKEKQSKTVCCHPTIFVQDRSVQCEIFNYNKLTEFNPVYILRLLKQLQDLVNKKDKRTYEIFIEIEQLLQKIPNLEIESDTIPLKESNKKIKSMSLESFTLERERLQSEILKQDERLKEIDQKYSELASRTKIMTQQLDEANREKNDMISMINNLKQQIESNESIIKDLKTDLYNQIEVAHKYYVENKYLTIQIDELSALSSCKDKRVIDYQNTIKDLQNQIAEQLKTINEIYMKEESTTPHISLIHTGHACSSPNSSISDGVNNKPWHDLTEISSIESISEKQRLKKDIRDSKLVSLLDGDTSHIISDQYENVLLDANEKGSRIQNNNESDSAFYQCTDIEMSKKILQHNSKKNYNKENDIYKTKKLTKLKEKQHNNVTSTVPTVSNTRKQYDNQNKKRINMPSPLRDCPHPDWSDSSLPSISTVSNLDFVPSNDI